MKDFKRDQITAKCQACGEEYTYVQVSSMRLKMTCGKKECVRKARNYLFKQKTFLNYE